jgi:hypothetical protein
MTSLHHKVATQWLEKQPSVRVASLWLSKVSQDLSWKNFLLEETANPNPQTQKQHPRVQRRTLWEHGGKDRQRILDEWARLHAKTKSNVDPKLKKTKEKTWNEDPVYHANVKDDTFVHFTPLSRAKQILDSNKLLANAPYEKFGIAGNQAVSLGYGQSVPGVQTTHLKDHVSDDDPLVAVVFQTNDTPSRGYPEETLWDDDVTFTNAHVVPADYAKSLFKPQSKNSDFEVRYDQLPLEQVQEKGRTFETGTPVEFEFIRNTEKAPPAGPKDAFQQSIEPSGLYVSHHTSGGKPPPGWITGTLSFKNPLVIAVNSNPESGRIYDENSWKKNLHRKFGGPNSTNQDLTQELLKQGYDGIVTVSQDKHGKHTSEIVSLKP